MAEANTDAQKRRVLITGGCGFIGSHVARRLYESREKYWIRIIDVVADLSATFCDEFIKGNLCDLSTCERAVRDVHTVLHFAATMGGMGMIHEANDFVILRENNAMTTNVLEASIKAGVKIFFFASSACVYPTHLQDGCGVSLRENMVWNEGYAPDPQGLYGLEKLNSELLVCKAGKSIDVRIARFHNIYGPGGAWSNGREKAPAAMLRQAFAHRLLADIPGRQDEAVVFNIWGTGEQRRSFLYIDDAVDAILKLLTSSYRQPLNIGSDAAVSIVDLAKTALDCAEVDRGRVEFVYERTKPTGVGCRNSNNDLVESILGWRPITSIKEGMRQTGVWIQQEMEKALDDCSGLEEKREHLTDLLTSEVVCLQLETITFAIILPITSKNSHSAEDCLCLLRNFADSLLQTTWRDRNEIGVSRFRFKIYLVIDSDDVFLLENIGGRNRPAALLEDAGVRDVVVLTSDAPSGRVCELWRQGARAAYLDVDKCHYFTLMGDDVMLKDEGWMRTIHAEFARIASSSTLPLGFGCVAFTDTSFPGMPTFPVVHRTHLDIFDGTVIPECFVNQDGDPYLFQLYRRWGCSVMMEKRIENCIGGASRARYEKRHLEDWTFGPLFGGTSTVRKWLNNKRSVNGFQERLVLDVIVPSYRVDLRTLQGILDLKPSPSCSVMFIIIVDNPQSPHVAKLEWLYGSRPDVRIRLNGANLGASASRNRGMEESASDWVYFLDDDVVPEPDVLLRVEEAVRGNEEAAGFIGATLFPKSTTIFTTAVPFAGVTFFWDIAKREAFADDVPWGVTANLIAKRHWNGVNDKIYFDQSFPKTGGGEDVDFCRRKRDYSVTAGGKGFIAAPNVVVTHPWWGNGKRSYQRFYTWAYGDGGLIKRFPDLTYRDLPNAAEVLLALTMGGVVSALFARWDFAVLCAKAFLGVFLANVMHGCRLALARRKDSHPSTVCGVALLVAAMESSLIRMYSELGRLIGVLSRGEFELVGRRFDWFAGKHPVALSEERWNSMERILLGGVLGYLISFKWMTHTR